MADWKWSDQFGADDDEENEEEAGYQQWTAGQRDGLIFLIDVTKPMFQKDDDDEISHFELCIKCAKNVIQNKIISSERDLLGVVFFGTEKTSNASDFKHITILQELDQPGAERVLQLEDFVSDDAPDFSKDYGHSEGFSISDALWTCSNMFATCKDKLNYKRVLLFTNNDNPHGNSAQLRRQAAAKAEDLHQNGIHVELMHLNPPGGASVFNPANFYNDVLVPDDDETSAQPDPAEKFDDLLTRVRAKDHKKRALCRLSLNLGKDTKMSVGVYNLVRRCPLPSRVKLYKKTNEEIKTTTRTFHQDTGEILMPQDMKKYQVYAGRKICFENEEVTEMKKFDEPGLKLMGFKPASKLKRYFHVKPAQFLYPDETNIEGSTSAFVALLRKCLERSVIAICRYIPRRNTSPRFVALVPQEEEMDEHNVQIMPPGFHLIFLPFADDFRKISFPENMPRANPDQIDKAKDLIKKLQFTFRPESFENPALQKHYANVEAMALDRDQPEEVHDYTLPDQNKMEKRAGRFMQEFKDLVFPEDYVPGAKRKAGGSGAAAKRPRVEVEVDIEKEARANRLGKLTVNVLKDYIKKNRINAAGQRKADLIDAISDHFGL